MTLSTIARSARASRFLPELGSWLAPRCQQPGCSGQKHFWRRLGHRRRQILLQGVRCCLESCFDRALRDQLTAACRFSLRPPVRHRIPLGLLLVSRQQLSGEQLRAALNAQRAAGHGRIGEWLQRLGYSKEEQVTAALARQWSCPVLRTETLEMRSPLAPQIPFTLRRWLAMAPVDFVPSTRTLHIALADRIDYSVLYAIERMLGCGTAPCVVRPSVLENHFRETARASRESEVLFEHVTDVAEFSRIVRSYAVRLAASEIRLAGCGPHVWVRLTGVSGSNLDLIVREVRDTSYPVRVPASTAM